MICLLPHPSLCSTPVALMARSSLLLLFSLLLSLSALDSSDCLYCSLISTIETFPLTVPQSGYTIRLYKGERREHKTSRVIRRMSS